MIMTKKKKQEMLEAYQRDGQAIKEYLELLREKHMEHFDENELKSFQAINKYLDDVSTLLKGFEEGLKGS